MPDIIAALKEYLDTETEETTGLYQVAVKVITGKKKLPGFPAPCEANALVVLHTDIIPFQEIAASLWNKIYTLNVNPKTAVKCNWFVCSSKGGIYLYEALAVQENLRYKKMKNRFIVFNTDNGTVSLGPGHIQNKIISERVGFLMEQARFISREKLLKELFAVFDVCLAALK